MDSMPGGGAEIFSERVRRIICDHKIDGNEWLETARIAHQIGLKSNCTMLYGHLETAEDRVGSSGETASRCRMKPTASSLSFRWPFTRRTRRLHICQRRPGSMI